jgi:hypothetical protein
MAALVMSKILNKVSGLGDELDIDYGARLFTLLIMIYVDIE